jgi:hypothetical protein
MVSILYVKWIATACKYQFQTITLEGLASNPVPLSICLFILKIIKVKTGEKVTVSITGTIVNMSNSHGLCFLVQLPQKDFSEKRQIWLNEDEITTQLFYVQRPYCSPEHGWVFAENATDALNLSNEMHGFCSSTKVTKITKPNRGLWLTWTNKLGITK